MSCGAASGVACGKGGFGQLISVVRQSAVTDGKIRFMDIKQSGGVN